jgi:hypothetical protein
MKKGTFIKHDQRPISTRITLEVDDLQVEIINQLADKYGCQYKTMATKVKHLLDILISKT